MISASGTGVCTDSALHKHKVLFMQIWFSHFEISALCFLCTLHTQHDLIPVHPINFYRLWCYNHLREALLIQMVVFGKISSSALPPPPLSFPSFFYVADFFTKILIWNSKAGIDWWRVLSCNNSLKYKFQSNFIKSWPSIPSGSGSCRSLGGSCPGSGTATPSSTPSRTTTWSPPSLCSRTTPSHPSPGMRKYN